MHLRQLPVWTSRLRLRGISISACECVNCLLALSYFLNLFFSASAGTKCAKKNTQGRKKVAMSFWCFVNKMSLWASKWTSMAESCWHDCLFYHRCCCYSCCPPRTNQFVCLANWQISANPSLYCLQAHSHTIWFYAYTSHDNSYAKCAHLFSFSLCLSHFIVFFSSVCSLVRSLLWLRRHKWASFVCHTRTRTITIA